MPKKRSGQSPFAMTYCEDLRRLPEGALGLEQGLHGGFAVDKRAEHGHIYYGLAGYGLLRVSPDLTTQERIKLPSGFENTNFHSTKIGDFDGRRRLFLPANNDEKVAVLSLEGEVEFILSRPEFDEYQQVGTPFRPTDTVLHGHKLLIADGYGANYISSVDLSTREWVGIFGGKTQDVAKHDGFGTAHGVGRNPIDHHLAIADRPNSRFEIYSFEGEFIRSHGLPPGSRPCGIDYIEIGDQWYAAVASLDDPQEGRPAPIYVLNASTYEVVSTIRPKEELGIERADHIHNVIWHEFNGEIFLVCQSWNPGYYFVLGM